MDNPIITTITSQEKRSMRTEPQRQVGGPESGLPPPYAIGQELASWLTVGIDLGSECRISYFNEGLAVEPFVFPASVSAALNSSGRKARDYRLKDCLAEGWSISFEDQTYDHRELIARFFAQCKEHIEHRSQRLVAKSVIAVPAGFTHRQRKSLLNAAKDAELTVLGLINETTAAALDAVYTAQLPHGKYIVISSGMYSFEASLVDFRNKLVEVQSILTNRNLSGSAVTAMLAESFCKASGERQDPTSLASAIESSKETKNDWTICRSVFTRDTVSGYLGGWRNGVLEILNSLLRQANNEIDGVILSGRACQFSFFQEILAETFGHIEEFIEADVFAGATIYAALLAREQKDWVIWDVVTNPILVAQGPNLKQVVSENSSIPSSGHVQIVHKKGECDTATIVQLVADRQRDPEQVALVRAEDSLCEMDDGTLFDLTVSVNADGLLSFNARQADLDTNLTLCVEQVLNEPELKELVINHVELYTPPIRVERIKNRLFVVETIPLKHSHVRVYDEVVSVDGTAIPASEKECAKLLHGSFRQKKTLGFRRGETQYDFEFSCEYLHAHRYDNAVVTDRLNKAVRSGRLAELIPALIDQARSFNIHNEIHSKTLATLKKAVSLTANSLNVEPELYWAARIELLSTQIMFALKQRDSSLNEALTEMKALLTKIDQGAEPPAVAAMLFDFAEQLAWQQRARDMDETRQLMTELVRVGATVCRIQQVDEVVIQNMLDFLYSWTPQPR